MGYPGLNRGKVVLKVWGSRMGFSKGTDTAVLCGGMVEGAKHEAGRLRTGGEEARVGCPIPSPAPVIQEFASDGVTARKRGEWGHLGTLSHEILEKERNTTPWPVLRSQSIWGWGRYI